MAKSTGIVKPRIWTKEEVEICKREVIQGVPDLWEKIVLREEGRKRLSDEEFRETAFKIIVHIDTIRESPNNVDNVALWGKLVGSIREKI